MKLDETWTIWKFLRQSAPNPLYKEMVLDRKYWSMRGNCLTLIIAKLCFKLAGGEEAKTRAGRKLNFKVEQLRQV